MDVSDSARKSIVRSAEGVDESVKLGNCILRRTRADITHDENRADGGTSEDGSACGRMTEHIIEHRMWGDVGSRADHATRLVCQREH